MMDMDNIDKNELFIEETLPNFEYKIVWRGGNFGEALNELKNYESENRLELWSKLHAESPKGFAPMAFRACKSDKVMISGTLKMLSGL